MSIEITVEIPLDVAAAIRDINYDLERIDGDVEFTLAMITDDIIRAVKKLPHESIPQPASRFSSASRDTGRTSHSSHWLGVRSCSGTSMSSVHSVQSSASEDSLLGAHMFPEFDLNIENEYGYSHRTRATGEMTIADLEAMLGPVCGFEPTWQSLTWHNYRLNQPHATLFSYGIDRYPHLEIKRRSPPAFDDQTLVVLEEPRPPQRAVVAPPPLPPRSIGRHEQKQESWSAPLFAAEFEPPHASYKDDWASRCRTVSGPWSFSDD
ncbi:Putative Ubiquitin-like domain superfamily [Septoria linicola]|uniref:Ubiquitin-like domain superfamily n=1 Tax=Septoria linicola TaxID=215465 RepID=A0A9Q9AZ17_9PEZI|nr:Putative Ubiquitin-like domain superfamily [Septoria linicola]